jgi:hypothetical protein
LPVYERLGDVRSRAVTMGQIANILVSKGDLDQALRIRQQDELPVFERLGDVRERAVTMGKIADILEAKGDLDDALDIHEAKTRPLVEQLGILDGLIYILLRTSGIRVAKGIGHQETFDRVVGDLSQAYQLAKRLTRLDFICWAAEDLGELLASVGAKDRAPPSSSKRATVGSNSARRSAPRRSTNSWRCSMRRPRLKADQAARLRPFIPARKPLPCKNISSCAT